LAEANLKIHKANHLKAQTIVPASLHFPSLDPTNTVWWMRCPFESHQSHLWSWYLTGSLWKLWARLTDANSKIHEANHLKAQTIVPASLHFSSLDPTNTVWLMRCPFESHQSHLELIFDW
jgi:hypothetical protein